MLGERHKFYCDLFDLNYNDGPYIVITTKRPDLVEENDELIFIRLKAISKERIIPVINILEQDIRKARDIKKRTLVFEELKQRLLTARDRYVDSISDVIVSWLKK